MCLSSLFYFQVFYRCMLNKDPGNNNVFNYCYRKMLKKSCHTQMSYRMTAEMNAKNVQRLFNQV